MKERTKRLEAANLANKLLDLCLKAYFLVQVLAMFQPGMLMVVLLVAMSTLTYAQS